MNDSIELLLKNNVDVNVKDKDGLTPLILSINNENIETIDLILNKNIDFNNILLLQQKINSSLDFSDEFNHLELDIKLIINNLTIKYFSNLDEELNNCINKKELSTLKKTFLDNKKILTEIIKLININNADNNQETLSNLLERFDNCIIIFDIYYDENFGKIKKSDFDYGPFPEYENEYDPLSLINEYILEKVSSMGNVDDA